MAKYRPIPNAGKRTVAGIATVAVANTFAPTVPAGYGGDKADIALMAKAQQIRKPIDFVLTTLSEQIEPINTRAEVAKLSGKSEGTVSKVEKILEKGSPEVIQAARADDALKLRSPITTGYTPARNNLAPCRFEIDIGSPPLPPSPAFPRPGTKTVRRRRTRFFRFIWYGTWGFGEIRGDSNSYQNHPTETDFRTVSTFFGHLSDT